jgi:hypothetical protein
LKFLFLTVGIDVRRRLRVLAHASDVAIDRRPHELRDRPASTLVAQPSQCPSELARRISHGDDLAILNRDPPSLELIQLAEMEHGFDRVDRRMYVGHTTTVPLAEAFEQTGNDLSTLRDGTCRTWDR